jgi:hypothetical protein
MGLGGALGGALESQGQARRKQQNGERRRDCIVHGVLARRMVRNGIGFPVVVCYALERIAWPSKNLV